MRKTPDINPGATCLSELIDWTEVTVTEPPLTCNLTTSSLKQFVKSPMLVPNWPSHTQSVERCVKMTTESAAHVFGQERREGYIHAQETSKDLMSRNTSKKNMVALIKFGSS